MMIVPFGLGDTMSDAPFSISVGFHRRRNAVSTTRAPRGRLPLRIVQARIQHNANFPPVKTRAGTFSGMGAPDLLGTYGLGPARHYVHGSRRANLFRSLAAQAPELLIGYNQGYRAGWGTVLGGISAEVIEDNLEPWSGDHCMDYTLVPGVLLSNHKLAASAPSLTDIAPTILSEFGVHTPPQMKGASVFEKSP